MCGFIGAVTRVPRDEGLVLRLPAALATLRHRGPDGEGQLVRPHALFGHTRLSVIDLTEAARQPMTAAHGAVTMVFNGEVYNYRELYAQYLDGHLGVNPHSDSSVLLGLYLRFGDAMVEHLCGMFAFAIHDARDATLLLARDRFGEKPLYYCATPDYLAFGSESRAVRKLVAPQARGIDRNTLAHYLHLGSVPAPMTIFEQVRALLPGHVLRVRLDDPVRGEPRPYWRLGQTVAGLDMSGVTLEQARAETGERLRTAMRRCLVADVPVGLYLSGGIDSGSIASLARSVGAEGLRGVTIDFPETRFSEYETAMLTARRFGIDVTRIPVEAASFERTLDGFFRSSDQPTSDGFNTYVVSEAAHRVGGKVWLSGVGGDELFGGYPLFDRITRLKTAARWMSRVPPLAALARWKVLPMRARRAFTLAAGGRPDVRAFTVARAPLPPVEVSALLRGPAAALANRFADPVIERVLPTRCDDFQSACALESGLYMGNQLLRDMDNFSMAHSIELRAPFLDHHLADYVFALPASVKRAGTGKKPLLTSSLEQALPDAVALGQKRGFTFPLELWIREHFAAHFADVLTDPSTADLLDNAAMRSLWERYLAGRTHWSVVWNVYALARWLHENGRDA